jgi:hypothetical protein
VWAASVSAAKASANVQALQHTGIHITRYVIVVIM